MNVQDVLNLIGKNATLEVSDVLALIEGQQVSIPVQPASIPVLGKNLVMALTTNAIIVQIK